MTEEKILDILVLDQTNDTSITSVGMLDNSKEKILRVDSNNTDRYLKLFKDLREFIMKN